MTLDDRADLFGDPSDTLASEAVWLYHRDNGDWPFIEEAVEALVTLAEIDEEEAERRIRDAIASDELEPLLRGGTFLVGYSVAVPPAIADRIQRRYLDVVMPRRDREEQL